MGSHGIQPDLVLPNWLEGPIYDFISYETGHCLMFFAASSLGWALVTLPTSYYENCVQGDSPEQNRKTVREWIRHLLRRQAYILSRCGLFIWMAAPLIERNQSPEAEYHSVFEWNLIIQVGLICWILFLKSLVPAKWLGLSPLQPGKTKLAIENLAERFNFPLGYIYTCANDNKARVDSDAVIFGNFLADEYHVMGLRSREGRH
jgi:hypothetical protein